MELVQRYLQVIKTCLPKNPPGQQDDIIAELNDTLMSRLEDRERKLMRTLTEQEIADEIKSFGHPVFVAARYFPQQQLIGATAFPFWWLAIKIGLGAVGLVHIISTVIALIHGQAITRALAHMAHDFIGNASVWVVIITLGFWVLEQKTAQGKLLQNWKPKNLPAIKNQTSFTQRALRINRTDSIFEIVFETVFLLFWVNFIPFPTHPNFPIALSDAWQPYIIPIAILCVIDILLALRNLITPYWSRERLAVRMACAAGTILIAGLLLQHDVLVTWQGALATHSPLSRGFNTGITWILYGVVVIYLCQLAWDGWRWLQCRDAQE